MEELLGGCEKNQLLPEKWLHNGMINPESFNYVPCLITIIIVCISFFIFAIKIIKRIYDVIILYLLMPISISSLPVDDGMVFKNWLGYFIDKILIIYSSVLAINLFFFMFPIINEFNIADYNNQKLFKLLLISGSSISVPTGQIILSRIFKINRNQSKSPAITVDFDNNSGNAEYYIEDYRYTDEL